jgi:2-dehydropantoate 2-reductase
MKILSIGVGAIGTYVCGNLALAGNDVVFLERPQSKAYMEEVSLKITDPSGVKEILSPNIVYDLGEALDSNNFDVAVLALKGYDLDSALSMFKPFASIMPPILCLLNGVENEGKIAAMLGEDKVLYGSVTTAVIKPAPGEIIIEKPRGIALGGTDPIVFELLDALENAGINTIHCIDGDAMKWSKMLTNLVSNATSAIFDKSPLEIYSDKALFAIDRGQAKELLTIMKKRKMKVVNLPNVPVRLLALVIGYFPAFLARPILVKAVGGGRGEKMPSFHIELHGGSGKSEVDNLNGAVVRTGETIGIATPINRLLNETLIAMTNNELSSDEISIARNNLIKLVEK